MLHKSKKSLLGIMTLLCPFLTVFAQMPVNGFYPEKNAFTVAPGYSYKSYDQFYLGSTLTDGVPAGLNEVSSSIVSFYGEYAFSDWLSSTVTLPYIMLESTNGVPDPVQGISQVNGVQDLGVFMKAKIFEKNFKNSSKLSFGGVTGATLPVGDYEGAGILSLGSTATSFNGSAIVHYALPFNIFGEVQAGYSLRTSSDFDIPNAMMYAAKIGYYNKLFYLHVQLDIQDSTSGFDIGTEEFAAAGGPTILPETEVDFTNLSFNFYVPVYKNNIGISTGYGGTLSGRNANKEAGVNFGLVYTAL